MFDPIDKERLLPEVGYASERRNLDFKRQATDDAFEMAKDVAALANAEGGTLLIGAVGKHDALHSYTPLKARDGQKVQRAYEQAVRDRCSPAPFFDVTRISKDGGVVVAVNVWPFPGQPIGVRVKKGEAKCGPKNAEPEGLFWFPMRVGSHTKAILPEQLPMLTDARVRRMAVLLQRATGETVVLSASKYRTNAIWMETAKVECVSVLDNSVNLTMGHDGKDEPLALPLDAVDAVWRSGDQWHVMIRGVIKPLDWLPGAVVGTLAKLKLVFDPDP